MGALGLEGRIPSKEQTTQHCRRREAGEIGRQARRKKAMRRRRVLKYLESLSKSQLVTLLVNEYDGTQDLRYHLVTGGVISP